LLEKEAAYLAAQKRTEEDIAELQNALYAYQSNVEKGLPAIEEDLKFHVKIADAGKNKVLKALMMIISPDIVSSFNKFKVCNDGTTDKSLEEHQVIMMHIRNQEPELAADAMESHLQDVLAFSKSATLS
jgi:GntR family transcriptional repressor for pyruvate dehydrogenase complex